MSRVDVKLHMKLLKEAKEHFKNVKPESKVSLEERKKIVVLTEEHIMEWLEVFYEDRIMLDGCNQSKIKY